MSFLLKTTNDSSNPFIPLAQGRMSRHNDDDDEDDLHHFYFFFLCCLRDKFLKIEMYEILSDFLIFIYQVHSGL